MRIWARRVALWIGVAFAAPALAGGWDKDCGQEGKAPCAWSEARFVGKQQSGLCATGQFFDLIEGGPCWTCPAGTARTVFAVNTDKACEKVAGTDFKRVNEHDKGTGWFGTDCPGGQFWDIVDGKCHSCPSGYTMQGFEKVPSDHNGPKGLPRRLVCAHEDRPTLRRRQSLGPEKRRRVLELPQRLQPDHRPGDRQDLGVRVQAHRRRTGSRGLERRPGEHSRHLPQRRRLWQ